MDGIFTLSFFLMLLPLIAVLAVTYLRSRKIYPLMFILSVFAYLNGLIYWIDAFELEKNHIIILLCLSAVFMVGLGFALSSRKQEAGISRSVRILGILLPLMVMVFFISVAVLDIGLDWEESTNYIIPAKVLFPDAESSHNCSYGFLQNPENQALIRTITVKNDFLFDRVKEADSYTGCLYPVSGSYEDTWGLPYVSLSYFEVDSSGISYYVDDLSIPARSQKTFELRARPVCNTQIRFVDGEYTQVFESLDHNYTHIILVNSPYFDCSRLHPEDLQSAVKIQIAH